MRVKDKFRTKAFLGAEEGSKSFEPTQFGDQRGDPVVTTILLKAWALHRMRRPTQFLDSKSTRRAIWDRLLNDLRKSLATKPPHWNDKAASWLRRWVPEA